MQVAGEFRAGLNYAGLPAEPPRDPAHGDIATNAAMVLSKAAGKKPRDIAEALLVHLKKIPDVVDGSVAGPGFINLKLTDSFWLARLSHCLQHGTAYADPQLWQARTVNVQH